MSQGNDVQVKKVICRGCKGACKVLAYVQNDHLIKAQMSGERERFVTYTFHKITVTGDDVCVMINRLKIFGVKTFGQHTLRERHTNGVAATLAKRAGCSLYSRRMRVFRVTRRFAVQLPKRLEFGHRQIITGEMKKTVYEHRAVPCG